ncbi:MAG: NAD(P)-dependent oxidoreductase [Phycisphaerae bacterium]
MTANDENAHATILFVEAEQWEHADLVHQCPHDCQVHSRIERLQDVGDDDIPEGVRILSPFIHSRVTADQLNRLPDLRLVATRSTGVDHIDTDACNDRGIVVSNVPSYGENTVAEHTFALLLALTRKIHRCYDRTVRGDFSIHGLRGTDLYGKTFGCLGTGKIGLRALRIAAGFGMRLLAYDVKPRPELAEEIGFEYVDFDHLLSRSDVLSVHVPYNKHTHHLIDGSAMDKMRDGAIVLNTARGAVVDTQALIEALRREKLGGAGLDVLESEATIGEEAEILSSSYDEDTLRNIVRNHALLRMPNVIITPHVGFNSREAVRRIIDTTLENIHGFLSGEPRNVVNNPGVKSVG